MPDPALILLSDDEEAEARNLYHSATISTVS